MAAFEEALLEELRGIRACLEQIACERGPAPEPESAPPTCVHPEDARIDFSGQGTEEWDCRVCGHQHRAVLTGVTE